MPNDPIRPVLGLPEGDLGANFPLFENYPGVDPSEIWSSRGTKKLLSDLNAEWLGRLSTWKVFITLSFKDPIEGDVSKSAFRRLVQVLNRDAFGNHYVQKVGHSYFSYILATEYQRRGVIHFHALADKPINFDLVLKYWTVILNEKKEKIGGGPGYAWLQPVKVQSDVVSYCSKYCVKGGQLDIYLAERSRTPMIGPLPPYWWK